MTDFKFGDLICYRYLGGEPHDVPLMYVGPCNHLQRLDWNTDLIDILDISGAYLIDLEHKDPSMWQRCWHGGS